ncbi:MAG: hypothetical protein Udaeo_15980 [Candidatus Udaeobacter sp.]|nr:MAG: hypothetical protein Udaeo_15980 [Candidatus Udaeobacter sp.]
MIGISTKSNPRWSNCRECFRGVDDSDILLGLIFENAQLGRAIFSDGAITIQVVGSEIEPEADRRTKFTDCFQLERAHFNRQHVQRLLFTRDLRKWFTDVAARDCSLAAGIQHLRQQFCRCGFSVRACYRNDWDFAGAPTQLELTDRFNSARGKIARQRRNWIDSRT